MNERDPVYPIYEVQLRWENDGEHDPEYPKWHEGLPAGRVWNGTTMTKMYRENPGANTVREWALNEWWPGYQDHEGPSGKLSDKNPGEPEVTVTFEGEESWCLEWFQHWTFDVGQTDGEALSSFQRYVDRYAHMQRIWPIPTEGYKCLMGAEERWRWKGSVDGTPENDAPAPCRCEHCKKHGVIRIGH